MKRTDYITSLSLLLTEMCNIAVNKSYFDVVFVCPLLMNLGLHYFLS